MASDQNGATTGGTANRAVTSTGARRPDPLIGTVVADRYEILELVGRGGMGVVYKARHTFMDRVVAIKMLLPQLLSDENAGPRFQREARAASKINHPNIMGLHDFGLTGEGQPYLVMDYIEGASLADVLKREGQIGVMRSSRIFSQVCDALSHAHELGIVHRDLKPGNIMLVQTDEAKDVVKVVDFGVAKMYDTADEVEMQRLTSTGELFGSPVYMSPEQCMGHELDHRSDIYSLGCVMYETLTGKLPHQGKTILETISKQLNQEAPSFADARPDLYIPEWLEACVMHCLEKDPAERPQTMREVQSVLAIAVQNHSTAQMRTLNPSSVRIRALSPENMTSRTFSTSVVRKKGGQESNRGALRWVIAGVIVLSLLGAAAFALNAWHNNQQTNNPEPPPAVEQPAQPAAKEAGPEKAGAKAGTAESFLNDSQSEPVVSPVVPAKTPTKPKRTKPPEQAFKPAIQTVSKPLKPSHAQTVVKSANFADVSASHHNTSVKPSRKIKPDFYDYATKHENAYRTPSDLPVKPWSAE